MKRLELPEPAAGLWAGSRDVLSSLRVGEGRPLTPHLGGGTILASRWKHRESTDIDITLKTRFDLRLFLKRGPGNLADKLGAKRTDAWRGRLNFECETGVIDLNTAPIEPEAGHERAEIQGRKEVVLSTVQILRGKLDRCAKKQVVRDAYDLIRSTRTETGGADLASAYSFLSDEDQTAVEVAYEALDRKFKTDAERELRLKEEPVVDLGKLGTIGSEMLKRHRHARLVIEIQAGRVLTEWTVADGTRFHDECTERGLKKLYSANGVDELLRRNGATTRKVADRIAVHRAAGRNGVVFDTADERPVERISGRNPSMKRAGAPATTAGPGAPDAVVHGTGRPAGGARPPRAPGRGPAKARRPRR